MHITDEAIVFGESARNTLHNDQDIVTMFTSSLKPAKSTKFSCNKEKKKKEKKRERKGKDRADLLRGVSFQYTRGSRIICLPSCRYATSSRPVCGGKLSHISLRSVFLFVGGVIGMFTSPRASQPQRPAVLTEHKRDRYQHKGQESQQTGCPFVSQSFVHLLPEEGKAASCEVSDEPQCCQSRCRVI